MSLKPPKLSTLTELSCVRREEREIIAKAQVSESKKLQNNKNYSIIS